MTEITTLEELTAIAKDAKTVAYFSAPWCGPCKALGPIMEAVASEAPDTKFVKIDVDNAPELASKYGVRSIPLLVLIEHEQEKKRLVGLRAKDEIKSEFNLSK